MVFLWNHSQLRAIPESSSNRLASPSPIKVMACLQKLELEQRVWRVLLYHFQNRLDSYFYQFSSVQSAADIATTVR